MREYLYIDDVEINSLLAQINKGLTTSKSMTRAQTNNKQGSKKLGGSIKGQG